MGKLLLSQIVNPLFSYMYKYINMCGILCLYGAQSKNGKKYNIMFEVQGECINVEEVLRRNDENELRGTLEKMMIL